MTKEEAIEILNNVAWLGTNEDRFKNEEAVAMAIQALEDASTLQGYGHWIKDEHGFGIECSECGFAPITTLALQRFPRGKYKIYKSVRDDKEIMHYCPYCGAKMLEVEDETN